MELWTFQRYQQPRLCIDAIERDSASPVVHLRSGTQTYRLAFDHAEAAAEIGAELATLTDSSAPLWSTLRESAPDSGWYALGTFLDEHSLICEARDSAGEQLERQRAHVEECAKATAAAVVEGLPGEQRRQVEVHATRLHRALHAAAQTRSAFGVDQDPFDAAVEPNFFMALLAIEFEYFRRSAPLTLAAADSLLAHLAGKAEGGRDPGIAAALAEACGVYDQHDLESHMWLVARCLVLSTSNEAARLPTAELPSLSLCSGLEFMRKTEVLTRETLAKWGENPYVTALEALNDRYSPLIVGPFIEQYHVTRRFVEIVAPLLSKRLSVPLRTMMFRYYSEEVGHEELESTTCEAMGVSQRALESAVPLPLHFAFVDALTLVAQIDPIASLASIMVIEGVFGEPPKMSLRLAAVARKNPSFREITGEHDELNETLNHNSLSRDAFEHITAVAPHVQRRVMQRILFLLELNQRAWQGIAEFYGPQSEVWLPGSLGKQLAPQG